MMTKQIKLSCYSDVLCFWAYAGQVRLDELQAEFAEKIKIEHHFISVFGNTENRIGEGWKDRGGYAGFSRHLLEAAEQFPHLTMSPAIWTECKPKTSATSHIVLKAIQLLESRSVISAEADPKYNKTLFEEYLWRVRCTFFEQARDIGSADILMNIAEDMQLPLAEIELCIKDGSALALLMTDLEKKELFKLEGSPSYILNDGRQKLYGNVGYRVIAANITELLDSDHHQLSWC